jgi:hypothetical protein
MMEAQQLSANKFSSTLMAGAELVTGTPYTCNLPHPTTLNRAARDIAEAHVRWAAGVL